VFRVGKGLDARGDKVQQYFVTICDSLYFRYEGLGFSV